MWDGSHHSHLNRRVPRLAGSSLRESSLLAGSGDGGGFTFASHSAPPACPGTKRLDCPNACPFPAAFLLTTKCLRHTLPGPPMGPPPPPATVRRLNQRFGTSPFSTTPPDITATARHLHPHELNSNPHAPREGKYEPHRNEEYPGAEAAEWSSATVDCDPVDAMMTAD